MVFRWVFFNSDVWTGLSKSDFHYLNVIYHQILWLVTGAQAKSPTEMLHLETAQIAVKNVITARRIIYLHNILKQPDKGFIKRVYSVMKESIMKDDWETYYHSGCFWFFKWRHNLVTSTVFQHRWFFTNSNITYCKFEKISWQFWCFFSIK